MTLLNYMNRTVFILDGWDITLFILILKAVSLGSIYTLNLYAHCSQESRWVQKCPTSSHVTEGRFHSLQQKI